MKDYYKLLGVSPQASDDEIKKAYRVLARRFHPDTNPGDAAAEARFKEATEAYEVLGDPPRRREYDMLRANPFAQARAGFGGQGPYGAGAGGFSGFGFDDLLGTIFRGASQPRPQAGADVEVSAEIGLEDAAKGTELNLKVGPAEGKRLKVKVPPGVATGTKLTVKGEGQGGVAGGPAGDLFVRIVVRPHPRFTREGDDLCLDLPVSVFDAVLGGEVRVPTLEGEVKLKVPAGTQSGQLFRLKGKGMPQLRGEGRGALLAKVMIQVPDAVGSADEALWRQLAEASRGTSTKG